MIDLAPHHLEKIRTILGKHVPQCEVRAFGSRVDWTAKDYSDLDLAVVASGKLSDDTLRYLKEAFEESDLPFRVEVLDWHAISPEFQKVIEKEYEVIQEAKSDLAIAGDNWTETTLGTIALGQHGLVDGPFGSNLPASAYTPYGIPVIRGSNLSLGEARFFDDDFVFVSEDTAVQLARSTCVPGDVVFTKKGTIGQTGFVPLRGRFERYLLSSNQMKLSVDPAKADALFVYYVVSSPAGRDKIVRDASVTGVPKTNVMYLRNFPIRLPPLPEQRAIAHILGTLDDKIELNRRMNETLEAMARALFKSWFVDFDPVRAKAEGHDPGLPKSLADLFPDSFEASERGEIPKGWEIRTIADLAEVSSGKRPEVLYSDASEEANVPLWGGNGPMGFVARALVDYPILLTGRVGTLGAVFRIGTPCWPSDNTLVLNAKQQAAFEYLFLSLKRIDLTALNRGSTQPLLTQGDLKSQPVMLPAPAALSRFHLIVKTLYSRIDHSESDSRTLAALRDTLVPKLISGEIRVKGGGETPGEKHMSEEAPFGPRNRDSCNSKL